MKNKIASVRKKIDKIDEGIITLLSTRKKLSLEIGNIKRMMNKKIDDESREKEIINRIKKLARGKNLNEKSVNDVYKLILKQSKKEQKNAAYN